MPDPLKQGMRRRARFLGMVLAEAQPKAWDIVSGSLNLLGLVVALGLVASTDAPPRLIVIGYLGFVIAVSLDEGAYRVWDKIDKRVSECGPDASPRAALADSLTEKLKSGEALLSQLGTAQRNVLSPDRGSPLVQQTLDWGLALEAELGDKAPEFAARFKRIPPRLDTDTRRSEVSLHQAEQFLEARIPVLAEIIQDLRLQT